MLYHLFRYLDEAYDLPGSGMFQYISFRMDQLNLLNGFHVKNFAAFHPVYFPALPA